MAIRVVTDSGSALADGDTELVVLPLTVRIGDREYREGLEVGADDIAEAMRSGEKVTTSQVPTEVFRRTFDRLLSEGADGIVSVHLSGKLSGTVSAARTAAADFNGRVTVVDSQGAAMAQGYPARAAATEAAQGGSQAEVERAALQTIPGLHTYFYLSTLEHLRRGGRIGTARALMGTALSVKPILELSDGTIYMREKVRTPSRGLQRLAALTEKAIDGKPTELTIHHLASPRNAHALAEWWRKHYSEQVSTVDIVEVGAAIGAHCGPGVVAIVASTGRFESEWDATSPPTAELSTALSTGGIFHRLPSARGFSCQT
ncbi:DegV family protein [Haloglycomyces albus]|uniref:DegV family protein n=1 Tax=Haloglycomyces albus TaxID=526067 RepID=UPI00046D47C9|nr:DegV family protein [Haloglycomyces albus]